MSFNNFISQRRRTLETISQNHFDILAKDAINTQPIRKEVSLNEIEIVDDTILKYLNTYIKLSPTAFNSICKIVGLPIGFNKTFTENFGKIARKKLLSRLQLATATNKTRRVTLILNPSSKTIEDIHSTSFELISNSAFLDTTINLIDRFNLEVNNFTTFNNGSIEINTSSPGNQFGIKGLKDEDFLGGITFSNSVDKGFRVSPFLYRMICINGLVGNGFEETLKLSSLEPKKMGDFFIKLNQLAERKFKPASLEEKINSAMNVKASLNEMEKVYDSLMDATDKKIDPEFLNNWIPFKDTVEAFTNAKINVNDLSIENKKSARTGTSIWDIVNGITHFATHDNGIYVPETKRRNLQRMAGDLLTKSSYDIENLIRSPFDF